MAKQPSDIKNDIFIDAIHNLQPPADTNQNRFRIYNTYKMPVDQYMKTLQGCTHCDIIRINTSGRTTYDCEFFNSKCVLIRTKRNVEFRESNKTFYIPYK